MILLIDNYDSFVYNLARYFECAGESCKVVRNDAITIEEVRALNPDAIVISPGPCNPKKAGISVDLVRELGHMIPVLGVCLGHQCIGEAYDGLTIRGERPMHGKASVIKTDGEGIFAKLPRELKVGRYHSLIIERTEFSPLRVTALGPQGEIMAVQHETLPVIGVQFHPESVLTDHGMDMVRNFLELARDWNRSRKIAA